ncbi:MAG: single-stranded DNA-binding protein [Anaerolineaceae bacterium]|nr:single-stranded DNA-binding protein [Anaerolineaceae bacterium]
MYQKLTIVGNLGRDPEMRYTPSGQAVTSFPVATNRTYTGSDGNRVKETTWFRISAWGKQAENCNNYLKKGSKVLIEGRLVPDTTTGGPRVFNRNDGTAGASFEVTATTVQFLDSRQDSEGLGGGSSDIETDDEIPF